MWHKFGANPCVSSEPPIFSLFTGYKIRRLCVNRGHNARIFYPLKGSWAGAMGQPQFMPTAFIKHAVDWDKDGKADIWNSTPDSARP